MKKIIPILVVLFALAIGAAAGGGVRYALGGGEKQDETQEHPADKHAEKSGGSGNGHGAAEPAAAFLKFSRQFITPVISGGEPVGMMVLDVNIELDPSISQSAYGQEPRLRDAVMGILLRQSANGKLRELFRDPTILDETKADILAASRAVLGDGARSVLILDIGYQQL